MSETGQARVLYDGKAKRTEFDEFEIGAEFTPQEITLTPEQIDYFCQGNHDYHEWYRDKEFIEYRVECTDEDGNEIFRTRRVHILDVLPRSVPRIATNEKTFNKLT
jgi:hypothetical protein